MKSTIKHVYIKGTPGNLKYALYEQLSFKYRLKLCALFINGGKMRLPFIDSDLLFRGAFKAGLTVYTQSKW